jgi:hypothetical protein
MSTPWTFGWAQLLTIVGFIITISIAVGGFRTFARWKKEKIEEKRIDTAIEALALVYESKFIFDQIRSEMSFPYEWKDMPEGYGPEGERNARGPFYAILKRIEAQKEFFERAWKIQVRCTALFGPNVEEEFLLMHPHAARLKFRQKCCCVIPIRALKVGTIWKHGIDFVRTFGLHMGAWRKEVIELVRSYLISERRLKICVDPFSTANIERGHGRPS